MLNVTEIRKDFPFFTNQPLAYLDNSATSQKPKCVLDAEYQFYVDSNANPFRGIYDLSTRATDAYENARHAVAELLHAPDDSQIVFTRNASESLNLLAYSFCDLVLNPGDEILVSTAEHHSNMLPWRAAAERHGATVKYLDMDASGLITPEMVKSNLTEHTRIFAVAQVSNIFGRENPIRDFAAVCHANGTYLVCDGAQSVPHMAVDVQDLDVDFLVFSGHKMLAPMGIGALYGRKELLEQMPPFLTGGEMIQSVSKERITLAQLPHKFEAGTVNAAGAVGLAEAIRYINQIGFDAIQERENALTTQLIEGARKVPHVHILGAEDPEDHHGIITFQIDGVHPHDVAAVFADQQIAVRAGHHCAQPLHILLGVPSTTRASLMFYNTEEEVDRFLAVLSQIRGAMGYAD